MANTLEVLNDNVVLLGQQVKGRAIWLVSDKQEAKALEKLGIASFYFKIGSDKTITDWTQSAKGGDWSQYKIVLNSCPIYVAFPQWVMSENKTKNGLNAIETQLRSFGIASFNKLELPPGKTVEDLIDSGQSADRIITEALAPAASVTSTNGASAADFIVDFANADFDFFVSDENEPFGVQKDGPGYAWMLDGTEFREHLTARYLSTVREVAPRSVVGDAISSIIASVKHSPGLVRGKLNLRHAVYHDGSHWLDLGRRDGKCVRFDAQGWTVENRQPVDLFFRRSKVTKELPIPDTSAVPADLKHLRSFVRVVDQDWGLLIGWMITHLCSNMTTPIALLVSEADAGKSTATMAVRYILEGENDKGALMPNSIDDVAVAVNSQSITLYNNLSKISGEMSDFLCQVVDGGSYEKRKLRTDSDVTSLSLHTSVLLNGISTGKLRADLKTRMALMELGPLSGGRKTETEILAQLQNTHPTILGALLSLTSQVLAQLQGDGVSLPTEPRMLDYGRVLAALDHVAGDQHLPRFHRFVDAGDLLAEDVFEDPVSVSLHKLVVQPQYKTTDGSFQVIVPTDFLMNTFNEDFSSDFMKSTALGKKAHGFDDTRQVGEALNRLKTDWARFGIHAEKIGQTTKGAIEKKNPGISIAGFNPEKPKPSWWKITFDPAMSKNSWGHEPSTKF